VSPAPKKPAAPKKPPAAKKPAAPKKPPAPPAEQPPVAASATRAGALAGSPPLSEATGQLAPGGSGSAPLPTMTPPVTAAPTVVAAVTGQTPGTALPRGGGIDEPWPEPVQIKRVSAAPLETGLSDYVFWVEYLAEHEPSPPPAGSRRGRIWA